MTMDAFETDLPSSMEDADRAIRASLAKQGFGVLTEIDVAATLRKKLGVERPPLVILGACNPTFAARALELDPSVALALPCNVVLEQQEGGTRIRIVDPRSLIDDERFASLAEEAAASLESALAEVAA
jgi:uncharacterized protein (DUF302 family)